MFISFSLFNKQRRSKQYVAQCTPPLCEVSPLLPAVRNPHKKHILAIYDYYLRTLCGNDYSLWVGPFSFTTAFQCPSNAVCATYNSGDISSDFSYTANREVSTCPGSVDIVIPSGYVLDSIETMYDYTAQGGAWLSEQRSRIFDARRLLFIFQTERRW